jgi:hypothetical protein
MYRLTMLIAAASLTVAGSWVTTCLAQNTREVTSPPADLHPPVYLNADTLRSSLAPSPIGLKPQPSAGGLTLPFGLDYRREAKALVMPLDEKSSWGVGVGMNLNTTQAVELSPNGILGLQPKRAPGLLLHKQF